MPRYIVRPKLGQHDKQFSGAEGANGAVIIAESAAKARELGASRLGKNQSQVEVIETDDVPSVISGPDRPLTKEEAAEIYNQGAEVVPGSWEPI